MAASYKAPYTENKKASNQKWDSSHLDRMSIALDKGYKDLIKQRASELGYKSVNDYLKQLITNDLKAGNLIVGDPDPAEQQPAEQEPEQKNTALPHAPIDWDDWQRRFNTVRNGNRAATESDSDLNADERLPF